MTNDTLPTDLQVRAPEREELEAVTSLAGTTKNLSLINSGGFSFAGIFHQKNWATALTETRIFSSRAYSQCSQPREKSCCLLCYVCPCPCAAAHRICHHTADTPSFHYLLPLPPPPHLLYTILEHHLPSPDGYKLSRRMLKK